MKLVAVADESVDQQIVEALRSNGHTVEAIVEICPGSTNDEVLALATSAGAVLLTQDKDFGGLVYRQGQASAGVLLIRLAGEAPDSKARLVVRAIESHGSELVAAFAVLEPTRLRIRRPTS